MDGKKISLCPSCVACPEVEITADEEWRDAISRGQLCAVTALTLPVMRRYGYSPTRH